MVGVNLTMGMNGTLSAGAAGLAVKTHEHGHSGENDAWIGGAICLTSSSLAVIGLNMQRWSLLRQALPEQRQKETAAEVAEATGWKCWWVISLAVYSTGQVGQLGALAYASQTLVSALSNVSLVTNVCVAHWCFGEPFAVCPPNRGCRGGRCLFEGWDLGAMVILGVGSTGVIMFAPSSHAAAVDYTTEGLLLLFFTPVYFTYFCCSSALAIFALAAIYCKRDDIPVTPQTHPPHGLLYHQNRQREGLLYAVVTGALGSVTITISKITMLLIKETVVHESQLGDPAFFIFAGSLVVCACLQLKVRALCPAAAASFPASP